MNVYPSQPGMPSMALIVVCLCLIVGLAGAQNRKNTYRPFSVGPEFGPIVRFGFNADLKSQFKLGYLYGVRLNIAPGISFGDYLYSTGRRDVGPKNVLEPFGWYLYAGGALRVSQMINNNFWIDLEGRYDRGLVVTKRAIENSVPIEGYPKPDFTAFTLTVNHTSRLFASVRAVSVIDKGDNKDRATRVDVSLGYRGGRR